MRNVSSFDAEQLVDYCISTVSPLVQEGVTLSAEVEEGVEQDARVAVPRVQIPGLRLEKPGASGQRLRAIQSRKGSAYPILGQLPWPFLKAPVVSPPGLFSFDLITPEGANTGQSYGVGISL